MADIEKLCKNLEAHGFSTSRFATAAEAADHICAQLSGRTIGFGGSKTVESLGLYERLAENNTVVWHWKEEDKAAALKRAETADVYICSANGVSETGEIVNIDGTGNRLAGTMFGRDKVFIVIGENKIEPDLNKAIWRARNIAAPLNARRFGLSTPCATSANMRCYDCSNPQRICKGLLVLWRRMNGVKECEVVIVGEEMGY